MTGDLTTTVIATWSATQFETDDNQGATSTTTTYSFDTTTTTKTGDAVLSDSTVTVTGAPTVTTFATDHVQSTESTTTATTTGSSTQTETLNAVTGAHTTTADSYDETTVQGSGVDSRGGFTLTAEDDTASTHAEQTGNDVLGTFSLTQTDTTTSLAYQSGGDSETNYDRTTTDTATHTTSQTGNVVDGSYDSTQVDTDGATATETGSDLTSGTGYTSTEYDDSTATTHESGNSVLGDYTIQTGSSDATSTLQETGTTGDSGYDLTKISTASDARTGNGNHLTGGYTVTVSATTTATSTETNSHPDSGAGFTETTTDSPTTYETGNEVTGTFNRTVTGSDTRVLDDSGWDSTSSDSVTESNSGSYTRFEGGDSVTGAYGTTIERSDHYDLYESVTTDEDNNFTLTGTGDSTGTSYEMGNSVLGTYTVNDHGDDTYTLTEAGAQAGTAFSSSLNGSEWFSVAESGNHDTGVLLRDDTGGGGYTLDGTAGSTSYSVHERADSRAGHFSISETGTDRYRLLPQFLDVSNTGDGTAPGNMDFHPYGEPFVDPWINRDNLPGWLNWASDKAFGLAQAVVEPILLAGDVGGNYLVLGLDKSGALDKLGLEVKGPAVTSMSGRQILEAPPGEETAAAVDAFKERAKEQVYNYLGGKAIQIGGRWVLNQGGKAIRYLTNAEEKALVKQLQADAEASLKTLDRAKGETSAAGPRSPTPSTSGMVRTPLAALENSCFVAGTPLQTPDGEKVIELFEPGDLVLSRSEHNPEAPVEAKVVEEVFIRVAPIFDLRVAGRVIRTTAEHPFYVRGKGWLCAKELMAGDLLASLDGNWLPVGGVNDTGEVLTVYNLRISDYHTYFVGSREWGFSVWAHNANYEVVHHGGGWYRIRNTTTGEFVNGSIDSAGRFVPGGNRPLTLRGANGTQSTLGGLAAEWNSLANLSDNFASAELRGITYEGTVYRSVPPQQAGTAFQVHPGNVAANHRYTGPGQGAVYAGTSAETASAEIAHYGASQGREIVSKQARVTNVLDLTNAEVRRSLGVTLEQITGEGYAVTQRIGELARQHGFSGLLVPSARNSGGTNLVVFAGL